MNDEIKISADNIAAVRQAVREGLAGTTKQLEEIAKTLETLAVKASLLSQSLKQQLK